ncbi:MAG: sigma 54-interacting transcriptional regulator [Thermodesulfobacteriota bacterium]
MSREHYVELIGSSKALHRIRAEVKTLSRSRRNVLIIGETGVGKSLVAESIHGLSKDSKKPIARLSLSAIDRIRVQELVKAIVAQRVFRNPTVSPHGDFRLPMGSTLVIEEIEKAVPLAQKALCELLEASKNESYGYRYIFLLTKELHQLKSKQLIADRLFTHLKQFEKIQVPALRDRPQDIIDLVEYFLHETSQDLAIDDLVIDPNTLEILVRQEWKGNVRELKESIAQSIVLSGDKQEFHLPEKFISEQSELQRVLRKIEEGVDFAIDSSMGMIEKRILERVLQKFNNNQSRAARFLRITEDTLRYRMKKLGIPTAQKQ